MHNGNKHKVKPALLSFQGNNNGISSTGGPEMNVQETWITGAGIRWGAYQNKTEHTVILHPKNESIVAHFQVYGNDMDHNSNGLREQQFVIYKEPAQPYELTLNPTHGTQRRFFELMLSKSFYKRFLREESNFLMQFDKRKSYNAFYPDFTAQATPKMLGIIAEMQHTPYSGSLNELFIESKITELFLLQITLLDNRPAEQAQLKPHDIERLVYIKAYLQQHFADDLSIAALAREAGINQTKLKSGFKQLFQSTLFSYINELRLHEAKRLLLEEKMYVNEVAYRVGYKYPHYFAAAFKKKFGIQPVCLKSY